MKQKRKFAYASFFVSIGVTTPLFGYASESGVTIYLATYEPMVIPDGERHGMVYDFISDMVKENAISANIDIVPLARADRQVLYNKYACAAPVARTSERESKYQWLGVVGIDWQHIFTNSKNILAIKDISEIRKYKIGALNGSSASYFLRNQGFEVDDAITLEGVMRKLVSGHVDFVVMDWSSALYQANRQGIKIHSVYKIRESKKYLACHINFPEGFAVKIRNYLSSDFAALQRNKIYERYISDY